MLNVTHKTWKLRVQEKNACTVLEENRPGAGHKGKGRCCSPSILVRQKIQAGRVFNNCFQQVAPIFKEITGKSLIFGFYQFL